MDKLIYKQRIGLKQKQRFVKWAMKKADRTLTKSTHTRRSNPYKILHRQKRKLSHRWFLNKHNFVHEGKGFGLQSNPQNESPGAKLWCASNQREQPPLWMNPNTDDFNKMIKMKNKRAGGGVAFAITSLLFNQIWQRRRPSTRKKTNLSI